MNNESTDKDNLETCYYHSEVPSVNKCEKCSQRICSNCSNKIKENIGSSSYIEIIVCPVCFYDLKIKSFIGREERRDKLLLGIMIILVLITAYIIPVTTLLFGSTEEAPFLEPGLALIFLIPITLFLSAGLLSILKFFIKGPSYAEEFRRKKENFLIDVKKDSF